MDAKPCTGCCFEVHGLPNNTVPQNCAVLASGQFQYFMDQACRESYLVETEDFVLIVRICPVSPDSRYAEVGLRFGPAPLENPWVH
jgi:hypothetical protein